MRNFIVFITCIALLLCCSIGNAQAQGDAMDMVNTTLPLEG